MIAGGQENMSMSPHILPGSRDGFRMGNAQLVDTMVYDGLTDAYNQYHMGITAENIAAGILKSAATSKTNWPSTRKTAPKPPRRPASLPTKSPRC